MGRVSTTSFTYYSFRFDIDWQIESDVLLYKVEKWIIMNCPKYAIFKEISDETKKPHIQGKIGIAKSLGRIKTLLQEQIPNTFIKSNYSMALIKKPEEYDKYICKDGKVWINNIFTIEQIRTLKEEFWKLNKEIKDNPKKDKAKNAITFTAQISDEFKDKHNDMYNVIVLEAYEFKKDNEKLEKAYDTLLGFILKRLGNTAKVFDSIVLQRMFNGVKNRLIMESDCYVESGTKFDHILFWKDKINY